LSVPPVPTPAALRASPDGFFGTVLETLPSAVIVSRPLAASEGEPPDFEIAYANPAAARIISRDRDALVGMRLSAWPVTGFAEAHRAVLDTGAPDVVKTGALEAELLPLAGTVVATLRHLDDSEAQLAEAQRIAHFGSWEWDMQTGTVTWSDELYRIYGITPEEYTPSYEGYLGRVHPDDREHVAAAIGRAAESHQPFGFEERILRPDGTVRVLESGGGVVVDQRGRPIRMVGACHDVTDRAHDQAELARRRRAEHQAKDINDSVVNSLVDAMQALDAGDLRGAQRAMRSTLEHASRIVTELVGATDDEAE
jgi:PAS domain S-box-containing protein